MIIQEYTDEELLLAEERQRKVAEAQEAIRAERQRIYDERDARLAEQAKAEAEARLAANPKLAERPEQRLARTLRSRLGDDAPAFLADLRQVNFVQFANAFALILSGEAQARVQAELFEAHQARHAAREAIADKIERQERAAVLGIA